MYEPVLMSKRNLGRLNKQQQDVIIAAGKKAQAFYDGKADVVNQEAIKAFEDHKVKVVSLSDADYQAWIEIAKKSSYARYAKEVPKRPETDRRSTRGEITTSTAGRFSPSVTGPDDHYGYGLDTCCDVYVAGGRRDRRSADRFRCDRHL